MCRKKSHPPHWPTNGYWVSSPYHKTARIEIAVEAAVDGSEFEDAVIGIRDAAGVVLRVTLAPTLQMRKIHLHLADVFFLGDGLRQSFVHLVHKLGAVLDHLIHRAVLQELPVLVAVDAVIFILGSIGIGAKDFIRERHPAALTKLHFHMTLYYFAFQIYELFYILALLSAPAPVPRYLL